MFLDLKKILNQTSKVLSNDLVLFHRTVHYTVENRTILDSKNLFIILHLSNIFKELAHTFLFGSYDNIVRLSKQRY